MSEQQDDVVSEARAMVERFRAAGRDCLQRYDASSRELGPSAPVRAEITVGGLRALLDALDRLDALAPLAEAAARVREAHANSALLHERYVRCDPDSQQAEEATAALDTAWSEHRRADIALLAIARGER